MGSFFIEQPKTQQPAFADDSGLWAHERASGVKASPPRGSFFFQNGSRVGLLIVFNSRLGEILQLLFSLAVIGFPGFKFSTLPEGFVPTCRVVLSWGSFFFFLALWWEVFFFFHQFLLVPVFPHLHPGWGPCSFPLSERLARFSRPLRKIFFQSLCQAVLKIRCRGPCAKGPSYPLCIQRSFFQ